MKSLTWLTSYFKGVQVELRKVAWPTFPTLVQHFLSVLFGVAFFTAFVGVVDYLFIHALALLITK
ncbi:MAG: SecE/Sec61-gamma subunit of protein translocation complex [Patescibacteria group bacterium]|jgi:preprotein translocase SecE subunit|nr:SecE/Sec61-gamma subunit of protein translocation complex [Patescibacteria group bacterium]